MNREAERKRLVELLRHDCYKEDGELHCASCVYDSEEDCSHHELADYLLDNGIVVPPVKVGQTVYYVSDSPINLSVQANTIYEAEVVRIVTTHLGTTLVIQIHNEYGYTEIPNIHEWQKTVYASREDAEKALKGDEGKLLYSDHVCTGEDCDDLLKLVNALPTVDIEEVVYCKECKYCVLMDDEKTLACVRQSAYKKPTDFCSRGKRKEAE